MKYHHGAHSEREISVPVIGDDNVERVEKRTIELSLMPNPSHLEFVNPVVSGKVRALQTDHTRSLAPLDRSAALGITIHGDAAFPGQGIVAETLNLQSLDGYSTGGTLHLIANNQVGFTTDPEDERSTQHSPTWPRASTSRSSTSTPTTSRHAAWRRGSRWRSASASSATS